MSVLRMLNYFEGRVVSFDLSDDKRRLDVTELCDMHFSVSLNKAEALQLVDEIKALAEQMVEE